jgi:hypothetical protein
MAAPYNSLTGPFSVAIFATADGLKRTAVYYGADERALYEADFIAAREYGYHFQGMWQPVWDRELGKQANIGGTFQVSDGEGGYTNVSKGYTDSEGQVVNPSATYFEDAYGVWRQVGNPDIID